MPSQDKINERANEWLREAPIAQGAAAAVPRALPKRKMRAGILHRIFGQERAQELEEILPEDTVRRLQYPVIERVSEDGKHEFEHDLGLDDRARNTRG